MKYSTLVFAMLSLALVPCQVRATTITVGPGDYSSKLTSLKAGDTLLLSPGLYTDNCTLRDLNGTSQQPIVIMGDASATVFQAQSCCNTVSITRCSYLVLSHFTLDGMDVPVDAIKAEGTAGNWAHHIWIENLNIHGYANDQQIVGINTKCSAWNWVIRKNIINGAGTGMYLGNSNGDAPFVAGIIENNCITHTVGYNIEIKHQRDTVRQRFSGTAVEAKTVIRHNVFSKDSLSSIGGSARPNLLVGGMPHSGPGTTDYYEIYGNFFYNNPTEALFQGTGSIFLYNNIFVNHFDPVGFRAIYVTSQNGTHPGDVCIAHNTVWTKNSSGGIRLYDADTSKQQTCFGNLVFSTSAITNIPLAADNVSDSYERASNYLLNASTELATLDLYPKSGVAQASLLSPSALSLHSDVNIDFNNEPFDWTYRGAYSGCCLNHGWKLQRDTMPSYSALVSVVESETGTALARFSANVVGDELNVEFPTSAERIVSIVDIRGQSVFRAHSFDSILRVSTQCLSTGVYALCIVNANGNDYQSQTFVRIQ